MTPVKNRITEEERNADMRGGFTEKPIWREIHDLHSLKRPGLQPNLRTRWNDSPTLDFAACRMR